MFLATCDQRLGIGATASIRSAFRGIDIRVVDAGHLVGVPDKGIPAQYFTVFTRPSGRLSTMFPGLPRGLLQGGLFGL